MRAITAFVGLSAVAAFGFLPSMKRAPAPAVSLQQTAIQQAVGQNIQPSQFHQYPDGSGTGAVAKVTSCSICPAAVGDQITLSGVNVDANGHPKASGSCYFYQALQEGFGRHYQIHLTFQHRATGDSWWIECIFIAPGGVSTQVNDIVPAGSSPIVGGNGLLTLSIQ